MCNRNVISRKEKLTLLSNTDRNLAKKQPV